jgi:hypothetical protein
MITGVFYLTCKHLISHYFYFLPIFSYTFLFTSSPQAQTGESSQHPTWSVLPTGADNVRDVKDTQMAGGQAATDPSARNRREHCGYQVTGLGPRPL